MKEHAHDPRLAAERRSLRLARWCRAALEVSAGVGYSAFLLVQAKLAAADPGAHGAWEWIAIAALIGLPLFPATLERLLGRIGPRAARGSFLVQALPLLALDVGEPAHFVLAPLALLQGNLLVRSGDDKLAGASVAVGPLQVLCGMALAPAPEWLFLFPLALVAALAALSLLLARSVEQDVLARAPRVLLRRAGDAERSGPREWTARMARALPLAALVLAVSAPFYALVVLSRAPFSALWEQRPDEERAERAERERAASARDGARGASASDASRQFFPESLEYGTGQRALRHRAVMEIRVAVERSQRRPPSALYMRGLVLDDFGLESADFAGGIPLRTFRCGDDGWARVAEAPAGDLLRLAVTLEPLFVGDAWSNVLFAPHPLLAVEAPAVRYDVDDRLTLPSAPQETITYGLLVPYPIAPRAAELVGEARHREARYVALPSGNEASAWIADRARELTRGARTDGERVARVLDHFHADYAYSLDVPHLPGLEGVVDFLRRRAGHCTSFSVAAVLLLRSLGISARVATGYLASDWSEEEELFRVTTRNGHAWIEVYFAERGWIPLDPTPPERRLAALAAAEAEAEPSLASWLQELRENAVFWSSTGGHESYLRAFFATLARGPAVLVGAVRRHPGPAALLALALVLLWAGYRARRPARSVGGWESAPRGELAGPYQALMRALAARGFRRHPAQTLREFALAVEHAGGAPFAPLGAHVVVLYRARFGSSRPTPEEARALELFVAELERERRSPE